MEGPVGYPPPTLVRRRPVPARKRVFALLFVIAALLAAYSVSRTHQRSEPPRAAPPPRATVPPRPAEKPAPAPAALAVEVENLAAEAGPAQPSVDGRKANRWHYVARLGDGPGAIYSRTGGGWDFAFACTPRTGVIEFISTGIGSPGTFDRQSIVVGKMRLMMDASYSKDGGGMISMKLPARHPLFTALDGSQPMEVQLLATRRTILPVGPELVRLIRVCRARG